MSIYERSATPHPGVRRGYETLDDSQQQRILDAVFRGPVTELIAEVVKRSLAPRKRSEDEAEYAKKTQGRLKAIKFEIPLDDQIPKADFRCRPTWDDRRRLATIGNTASIGTSRALHHAVRVGHHLFRTVMMEIMATSEQTGEPIRELLAGVGTGSGIRPVVGTEQQQAGEKPPLGAATPTVVAPEVHHAVIAAQNAAERSSPMSAEAAASDTIPSSSWLARASRWQSFRWTRRTV